MPRKARIDAPGAFHHIIIRGIERRKIFRDDSDRRNFLTRFGKCLQETETACFAWALIPNHAHFLLRTGLVPIATVMRRVLTGYAVSFNRRYRRHGKVFQNRYKSILCQEDLYLKELVRYIHLNPLRAKLVMSLKELGRFKWCGHSVLTGNIRCEWQNRDYVLGLFADKTSEARRRYRDFVQKGIAMGKRPELIGGGLIRSAGGWSAVKAMRRGQQRLKGDERILGDSDFVQRVLKAADEKLERSYRLKAEGLSFDKILEKVAEAVEIRSDQILARGKTPKQVRARSLLCYYAQSELGMSTVALSNKLSIVQSAASRSIRRGERLAREKAIDLTK